MNVKAFWQCAISGLFPLRRRPVVQTGVLNTNYAVDDMPS